MAPWCRDDSGLHVRVSVRTLVARQTPITIARASYRISSSRPDCDVGMPQEWKARFPSPGKSTLEFAIAKPTAGNLAEHRAISDSRQHPIPPTAVVSPVCGGSVGITSPKASGTLDPPDNAPRKKSENSPCARPHFVVDYPVPHPSGPCVLQATRQAGPLICRTSGLCGVRLDLQTLDGRATNQCELPLG